MFLCKIYYPNLCRLKIPSLWGYFFKFPKIMKALVMLWHCWKYQMWYKCEAALKPSSYMLNSARSATFWINVLHFLMILFKRLLRYEYGNVSNIEADKFSSCFRLNVSLYIKADVIIMRGKVEGMLKLLSAHSISFLLSLKASERPKEKKTFLSGKKLYLYQVKSALYLL